ncbi:unnamed protein product [Rotaria magnacalcarata]|uniref:Uncharacterized protein n=1 Tax=Rotaria magnacalcarata TaxID=392030 RepID=A0A8S3F121_9BILA|nr:unnamed protein product [Rotaria magnacalcarata]
MGGSSTKTLIQQHVKEGGNAKIILGDTALSKVADTPVQTALKAAGKPIESGSDLIAVPALWLKDMQKIGLLFANKNSSLQTQLPLSGSKLSSASPSTVVDLGV